MENLSLRNGLKNTAMRLFRLLIASLLLWGFVGTDRLSGQQFAQSGNFDFYVFTLSWSPQFCASTRTQKAECHVSGNNFVVHGLWPQWRNGSWPANCSSDPGPADPSTETDIMGDPTLVEHEWETHGTCSGLGIDGYFAMIKKVRNSITIPERFIHQSQTEQTSPASIKSSFLVVNPQLKSTEISIGCSNNVLVQVQVCFSKDGKATDCSGVRDCRAVSIKVLPVLH